MLKGLNHIALKVLDIKKVSNFYIDVLGFTKVKQLYDEAGKIRAIVLSAMEKVFLELFFFDDANTQIGFVSSGYMHICFEVDDIFKIEKMLEEKRVQFKQRNKRGKDGNYQLFVVDPEGNELEFVQKFISDKTEIN